MDRQRYCQAPRHAFHTMINVVENAGDFKLSKSVSHLEVSTCQCAPTLASHRIVQSEKLSSQRQDSYPRQPQQRKGRREQVTAPFIRITADLGLKLMPYRRGSRGWQLAPDPSPPCHRCGGPSHVLRKSAELARSSRDTLPCAYARLLHYRRDDA